MHITIECNLTLADARISETAVVAMSYRAHSKLHDSYFLVDQLHEV